MGNKLRCEIIPDQEFNWRKKNVDAFNILTSATTSHQVHSRSQIHKWYHWSAKDNLFTITHWLKLNSNKNDSNTSTHQQNETKRAATRKKNVTINFHFVLLKYQIINTIFHFNDYNGFFSIIQVRETSISNPATSEHKRLKLNFVTTDNAHRSNPSFSAKLENVISISILIQFFDLFFIKFRWTMRQCI